jgi:L-cystine uptake protein TcyP (sodium:dicarboxylate symporter family)
MKKLTVILIPIVLLCITAGCMLLRNDLSLMPLFAAGMMTLFFMVAIADLITKGMADPEMGLTAQQEQIRERVAVFEGQFLNDERAHETMPEDLPAVQAEPAIETPSFDLEPRYTHIKKEGI